MELLLSILLLHIGVVYLPKFCGINLEKEHPMVEIEVTDTRFHEKRSEEPFMAMIHFARNYPIWVRSYSLEFMNGAKVKHSLSYGGEIRAIYRGQIAEMQFVNTFYKFCDGYGLEDSVRELLHVSSDSEIFYRIKELLTSPIYRAKAGMLYAAGVNRSEIIVCLACPMEHLAIAIESWKRGSADSFLQALH